MDYVNTLWKSSGCQFPKNHPNIGSRYGGGNIGQKVRRASGWLYDQLLFSTGPCFSICKMGCITHVAQGSANYSLQVGCLFCK